MARAQAEWAKEEKRLGYEAARLRDKVRDAEVEAERWKKMLAAVETQTASLEDSGAAPLRCAWIPCARDALHHRRGLREEKKTQRAQRRGC